jgi:hypothetical protein
MGNELKTIKFGTFSATFCDLLLVKCYPTLAVILSIWSRDGKYPALAINIP